MPRTLPTLFPSDLELRLLQREVVRLEARRDTCGDCGRTPLTGELVHHYGALLVCELCRQLRRRAPERTEKVQHSEHGQTVKVRAA